MKYFLRQNRRSESKGEARISLFPFLAVLICTMGALVPLLMAITYVATQQAKQAAAEKIAKHAEHVETEIEDARWRIEQMQTIREANENELAQTRLELSHLEDHQRRLRKKLEGLKAKLKQLERPDAADAPENAAAEDELRRLQAEIDAARRKLDEAHRAAAARKQSYAIIPYDGPNQTRRRPIYIECRADAVVLQPEGIELIESDFDGPLGPGNPLAAALRAESEYIQSRPGYDYKSGVPYPMLLVRPDGVEAYYVARAAMTSWAADFGYEMIGDDWQLAFPRSDPQLSETLRQVVASARVRQARLAAAAPSHRGVSSKVVYRAAPTGGGFIREQVADDSGSGGGNRRGGGEERRDERGARRGWGEGRGGHGGGGSQAGGSAYPSQRPATALAGDGESRTGSVYPSRNTTPSGTACMSGNRTGATAGMYGNTTGATAGLPSSAGDVYQNNTAGQAGSGTRTENTFEQAGSGTRAKNTFGQAGSGTRAENTFGQAGSGTRGGQYGSAGNGGGEYPQSGSPGTDGGYAPSNASSRYGENNPLRESQGGAAGGSPYSDGASGSGERPEGYVAGQPPSEQTGGSQSQGGAGGQAILPGQWIPSPPKQSGASGGGGQPGGGQPSDGKAGTPGGGCQMSMDLTEKRGKDWGLRDASRGAVGISRPIRVECHADRLVFHAERGLGAAKTVSLGPRLETSADEMVSAVWDQIEAWGIAGKNMYWRPVLKVAVAPDAERRFDELKKVLDGSGIAVEKK